MKAFNRMLRVLSAITLFFFCWTFIPLFQLAAYAAEKQTPTKVQSSEQARHTTNNKTDNADRLQKALEEIQKQAGKANEKFGKNQDASSELAAIKAKRSEIESLDTELTKEFAATETKLKDANLPKEILDRHHKFVKHYNDNVNQLKAEINDIEKTSAKGDKVAARKALASLNDHIEKTKPPRKHKPLDPNNLPNRMVKGKAREPRLKKEDFEKDFPKQKAKTIKTALTTDEHRWPQVETNWVSVAAGLSPRKGLRRSPVMLASNSLIASDMPLQLPSPNQVESRDAGRIVDVACPMLAAPILFAQAIYPPVAEDLQETPEVKFTPELRQIASLLDNNPVQMYEFVRNNFTYDPYYGSIKGSQSALLLQSGNDFDQASVLIALFRVSGIPARYVYGTIEIPIEKVMKWLGGITDPQTAGLLLATNGIPAKLIISGNTIKSIQLEHVWTEVYLPYSNYRGLINDPAASKTWIPLDPSFKLTDANPNAVDMADLQQFDIDAYLTNYLQTIKPTTPAKDYLATTINYVTNNLPGQSFYDLLASGPIADNVLDLLPDTLYYPVAVVGARFSSVPESYRHKIDFVFTNPATNEPVLSYSASWSALLDNRFTISYEPATSADDQIVAIYGDIYSTPPYLINVNPVLKVEGATVAEGSAVGLAANLAFKMSFIGPNGTVDNIVTNSLTVGATYAIGLGSGYTTGRIITYRTSKLDAAATAGEQGDSIIGEYLNLLAMNYLQELDSSRKLVSKSMKVLDTYRTAELMVGVDMGATTIFGVPRSVSIKGLLMDVDYNTATPCDINGNQSKVRRFQILAGTTSSALEHSMFEKIVGIEAVSTIKALEVANTQGIPVHQIDASNIAINLPVLQLTPQVITDIQNAVSAGKVVIVSERSIQINNWSGVGYIVLDQTTGAGAYLLSNGLSGGSLTQMTSTLAAWIRSGNMTKDEAVKLIAGHRDVIWFPAPVDGSPTAQYDETRPNRTGGSRIHGGLDFRVPNWTPVSAVAAGTVANAYTSSTYGNVIIIDHGAGVQTFYAHNCEMFVKTNDTVQEGQVIARSGNTGVVTSGGSRVPASYFRCSNLPGLQAGAHVHFELRVNDIKVDPMLYGIRLY